MYNPNLTGKEFVIIAGMNGYVNGRDSRVKDVKNAQVFASAMEASKTAYAFGLGLKPFEIETVEKAYLIDKYPADDSSTFGPEQKSDGFICGAWRKVKESDGVYVTRCDRAVGHTHDHCDSVVLVNWRNTFNSLPNLLGE